MKVPVPPGRPWIPLSRPNKNIPSCELYAIIYHNLVIIIITLKISSPYAYTILKIKRIYTCRNCTKVIIIVILQSTVCEAPRTQGVYVTFYGFRDIELKVFIPCAVTLWERVFRAKLIFSQILLNIDCFVRMLHCTSCFDYFNVSK